MSDQSAYSRVLAFLVERPARKDVIEACFNLRPPVAAQVLGYLKRDGLIYHNVMWQATEAGIERHARSMKDPTDDRL